MADVAARFAGRLRRRDEHRLHGAQLLQLPSEHAGLDWQKNVKFDERYLRPTEVDSLIGDPAKANDLLGSNYPNVLTPRLAQIMVDAQGRCLIWHP